MDEGDESFEFACEAIRSFELCRRRADGGMLD